MGTPTQAYNEAGEKVWHCELDTYGKVNTFTGESSFVPFRYQGQYEDTETGLYYNRFRYYDCNDGRYISEDPISLASGEPNYYAYVEDSNTWVDVLGLSSYKPNNTKKDFNQARNEAIEWLEKRGVKVREVNIGKMGATKGKPVGMIGTNSQGQKAGFRVEYDIRSGAHINVFSGKEKGPHIKFEATEKTVNKIQRKYGK